MALFQIFYTAPLTLKALNGVAFSTTAIQEMVGSCAAEIREVGSGIQFSHDHHSLVFFGPGTSNVRNPLTWGESRKISLGLLQNLRKDWGLVDRGIVRNELSTALPESVKDEFCRLGGLMRSMKLRMGTLWPWGDSASQIEGSIQQRPTPEILQEARLLIRGAEELTSQRTHQLFEGIHTAIAFERENVRRSLFHARLAVGGICTALVIGFSVCAYFLSQPMPRN